MADRPFARSVAPRSARHPETSPNVPLASSTPTGSRPDRLKKSGIREILDLVFASTGDIDRLEIGEPGYFAAPHIAVAAAEAAHGRVGYTQSAGTQELRNEIVASLGRRYGLDLSPDRILVSAGGSQGIAAVFEVVVGAGDEVLIPDPAWPNYESMTLLRGATPTRYPLRAELGFIPDPAEVAALITPNTRVLVLNSPSNPTGAVVPRPIIERIVRDAAARGVLVISDEVYDELIFDGEPSNAAAIAPDSVVSVFSFSKTYAMTGWRVGYLVLPAWLADSVIHVQETLLSCVSTVSQAAAVAALTGPQDAIATMRAGYQTRARLAVGLLAEGGIPVTAPSGAFYLMIPLPAGVDSRSAALDLVGRGVSFAPGTAFGLEAAGMLRLSLASSDATLTRGLSRFLAWHHETGGGVSPATAVATVSHIEGRT
jgi:aspartate aminotransferase